MRKEEKSRKDPRAQFQDWYARNKDERNRQRREKYAKDKAYRKKQIERSREYRKSKPKVDTTPTVHMLGGVPIEVYRISAAAEKIGRYPKRIVEWEKRGWIPRPTIESAHRMYTARQVRLMHRIAEALDFKGTRPEKRAHLDAVVEEVHASW